MKFSQEISYGTPWSHPEIQPPSPTTGPTRARARGIMRKATPSEGFSATVNGSSPPR